MGRIKNKRLYPLDIDISGEELLIGSDTDENGKTRNYKIKDIARYVFASKVIEGIDQNNVGVVVSVGNLDPSNIGRSISEAVNLLDEFEVDEDEIFYFSGFTKEYISPIGDGTKSAKRLPETIITNYLYFFNKGKGLYGESINNPTIPVADGDFLLIDKDTVSLQSVFGGQPVVYTVRNREGKNAVDAINDSGNTYSISNESDVYFQVENVYGSRATHIYRFVGAPGVYGDGGLMVVSSDLLTLKDAGIDTSGTRTIRILEFETVFLSPGQTKAQVINGFGQFEVTKDELALFSFRKSIGNGKIEKSSWFSKRGAGRFGSSGSGGNILQLRAWEESDLVLNEKSIHYLIGDPTGGSSFHQIDYVVLPSDDTKTISQAINTNPDPLVVDSGSKVNVIEKDEIVYQFVGKDGIYGVGHSSCTDDDLYELEPSDKHIKIPETSNILESDNVFTGKNEFDQGIEVKQTTLQTQTTLPPNAEEGTMVKLKNDIVVFNNGQWQKITLTPLSS